MNSKVSKYLIRIVLIFLGLSVIGVTLFLFLYVFWKGKTVMSLSFHLDNLPVYQSELPVEFSRLLWDLFISVHLPH